MIRPVPPSRPTIPFAIPVEMGHAYPGHQAAFACARGWGARAVRRGRVSEPAMIAALRHMVAYDANAHRWPVSEAIVHAFVAALSADRHRAGLADDEICRAVAPLLDARARPGAVRQAARAAAGDWLDADEIEPILRREAAWWVRLHASMEDVQHAA